MAVNRGTFEVEEARAGAEPKPQRGVGSLSLQAQIGMGVGVLVFGVLLGALIIPGRGGKKESGGSGGGSGGDGGAIVEGAIPIRFSVHGGAPFHVAFMLEQSEKASVVQKHSDWFDGSSPSDEEFKQRVSEKLKSFVPEQLDGVKIDFVSVTEIDKDGWWGWMTAGAFGKVTGAADFTLTDETTEVKEALEKVSVSLKTLNMGGLAPFVEMAAMDKLQTRYVRELRGKITKAFGDETKFKVDVLPNISDVGAFTDAVEEAKYQHDLVFHMDIKDKSKVCATTKMEGCDKLPGTSYVEKVTELCQKIVREQLSATSMVTEKNCAVAFGQENEADVGSDSPKTSFWLTDGLSCVFQDGSDPLKDISDALKTVEQKTKVPLGDILRSLQEHQWEQYHVSEIDAGLKQHLESEVGATVDQVDVGTMKAIRRWEEQGRCCIASQGGEKFWVQLNLLKSADETEGEPAEGMTDEDLEMLSLSGHCPDVDAGSACAGKGVPTAYANPLECSDGKLTEDIKNVAKEIKKKCA